MHRSLAARLVAPAALLALASMPACTTSPAPTDAGSDMGLVRDTGGGGPDGALDAPFDSPDTGPLSDGEIVGVLHAIHAGQIQIAQFVASRATTPEVIAFANDMASRYQSADASLTSAASAAGITSTAGVVSTREATLAGYVLDALHAETCAGFDRTYLTNHLATDDALHIIDANLLPAVMNTSIHGAMDATRALLVAQQIGPDRPDTGVFEASVPNWEAGPYEDSGCPPVDAYYDVGTDS